MIPILEMWKFRLRWYVKKTQMILNQEVEKIVKFS